MEALKPYLTLEALLMRRAERRQDVKVIVAISRNILDAILNDNIQDEEQP